MWSYKFFGFFMMFIISSFGLTGCHKDTPEEVVANLIRSCTEGDIEGVLDCVSGQPKDELLKLKAANKNIKEILKRESKYLTSLKMEPTVIEGDQARIIVNWKEQPQKSTFVFHKESDDWKIYSFDVKREKTNEPKDTTERK